MPATRPFFLFIGLGLMYIGSLAMSLDLDGMEQIITVGFFLLGIYSVYMVVAWHEELDDESDEKALIKAIKKSGKVRINRSTRKKGADELENSVERAKKFRENTRRKFEGRR